MTRNRQETSRVAKPKPKYIEYIDHGGFMGMIQIGIPHEPEHGSRESVLYLEIHADSPLQGRLQTGTYPVRAVFESPDGRWVVSLDVGRNRLFNLMMRPSEAKTAAIHVMNWGRASRLPAWLREECLRPAPVALSGPADRLAVIVTPSGQVEKKLTKQQYKLIGSLVVAAGRGGGLSQKEIEAIVPSAREILRRLRADEDWGRIIRMAEDFGSYSVAHPEETSTKPPVNLHQTSTRHPSNLRSI